MTLYRGEGGFIGTVSRTDSDVSHQKQEMASAFGRNKLVFGSFGLPRVSSLVCHSLSVRQGFSGTNYQSFSVNRGVSACFFAALMARVPHWLDLLSECNGKAHEVLSRPFSTNELCDNSPNLGAKVPKPVYGTKKCRGRGGGVIHQKEEAAIRRANTEQALCEYIALGKLIRLFW